tara:strand:- start:1683 stop:3590 length:1908 start_codon:yes stop_codon:yes gene_type:complete
MSYQAFLIAPFATGLDTDLSPWLLPQDAFSSIVNGHINHGVIEKREGYSKLGDITYDGGSTPGNRVMGLERYIDSDNVKEVIAFDTKRASAYNPTTMVFDAIDTADIMTGGDTDYIWADNWASTASSTDSTLYRLYFTNGKPLASGKDGIRYYNGGSTTLPFNPTINSMNTILGCKLIFAFHDRLLLLHTIEGNSTNVYPQRARWSQAQNPGTSGAFTDEWDDAVAGKGGYVDAPTGDHIISAQFVQNRLIVFFTDSVWSLSPTADPALPFRWDKINDFRSCDGKMTTAQFDRYVLAAGIRGITATDGVETQRMDERIENFVDDTINSGQFDKVFSKRDFGERKLWMLYPSENSDDADAALIYDEESSAFSIYTISMNVLGYGGAAQDSDLEDFGQDTLLDFGEAGLNDFYFDAGAEIFLGGDRSGQVFTLGLPGDEGNINFELMSAAWNPWMQEGKQSQMGYVDLYIDTNQYTKLEVSFFVNNDPSSYRTTYSDPYASTTVNMLPNLLERGTISNITQANPGNVGSNNHGLTTGDKVFIYGVEGMLSINDEELTVTVVDDSNFTIGVDTSAYGAYTSGGVITERKFFSSKVWKRIYAGGTGYQHRMKIESSGITKPVRIHAFMPWFKPRGQRPI